MIVKTRVDNYCGTAVAFKKSIKLKQISYSTERDIFNAQTTNLSKNCVLVSVYFPPNLPLKLFKSEIEKLMIFLIPYSNVLFAGDFIVRNRTWDDYVDNRKEISVNEFTSLYDFECLTLDLPTNLHTYVYQNEIHFFSVLWT